jgi:hypothetical protein
MYEQKDERNKCSIVSWNHKKKKKFAPVPIPFNQLVISRYNFFMKEPHENLILSGIFSSHKYLRRKGIWPFMNSKYIDLTENVPQAVSLHINLSGLQMASVTCTLVLRSYQLPTPAHGYRFCPIPVPAWKKNHG